MKAPRNPGSWTSLEYAWPERVSTRDPWAGDEALFAPGDYANYKRFAPHSFERPLLGPAAYAEAELRFHAVMRDVLEGAAPWTAIRAPADELAVLSPARHDRRPLRPVPIQLHDDALADTAEDWVPDIGLVSAERVFGPWAEGHLERRWRRLAGAVMGFAPLIFPDNNAINRACRNKPRPPRVLRASMRGIGHAPPMLWRIDGQEITPLLPLGRVFRPVGPVRALPDAPAAIGRAVPGPEGWFLACTLPLPEIPPPALLLRRMKLELLDLRRTERRATWEDALRGRIAPLYRVAASWLWLQRRAGGTPLFDGAGAPAVLAQAARAVAE